MKHDIWDDESGLRVDISKTDGKREDLLKAFHECQEGRCSCPTDEYRKLDKLVIEHSKEGISLHLIAKKGEEFDVEEIEKCINHTEKRINPAK